MSAPQNPPLMSIMNSPLLRQQQEKTAEQTPEQTLPPTTPPVASAPAAVSSAAAAGAVGLAPYGFDPAGPTPPLVPVHGADAAAVPVSAVPVSAGVSVVAPVSVSVGVASAAGARRGASGEPVIPAYLRQRWADVEIIQEQVSNRLSLVGRDDE